MEAAVVSRSSSCVSICSRSSSSRLTSSIARKKIYVVVTSGTCVLLSMYGWQCHFICTSCLSLLIIGSSFICRLRYVWI
jgi:hypothetical protein